MAIGPDELLFCLSWCIWRPWLMRLACVLSFCVTESSVLIGPLVLPPSHPFVVRLAAEALAEGRRGGRSQY